MHPADWLLIYLHSHTTRSVSTSIATYTSLGQRAFLNTFQDYSILRRKTCKPQFLLRGPTTPTHTSLYFLLPLLHACWFSSYIKRKSGLWVSANSWPERLYRNYRERGKRLLTHSYMEAQISSRAQIQTADDNLLLCLRTLQAILIRSTAGQQIKVTATVVKPQTLLYSLRISW